MSNESQLATDAPKNGAHHIDVIPTELANGLAAPEAPDASATAAVPSEAADTDTGPSFDVLGLHQDVRQALDEMGYLRPTAVQAAVFAPVSQGKDLMVAMMDAQHCLWRRPRSPT